MGDPISRHPILDIRGIAAFFRENIFKKVAFCLFAPPNQISFLTISNENIFYENQGPTLSLVITPNIGLEQVLNS